ncbi:hypothetical protein [Curtobacterium sp. MCSS17_016]|uniref:hypothetical protein n=1 Tax=Curtobacterium sp. MCSS17_016 TaxID=2175644 RepID=UPI000DAA071B|nr:hypothetical protein [Curtobacterium sp. MCSS17_016]WIE80833.1 hypothetical protein DEJ19_020165 [Curtobacterium sp. MCSS17_016]
MTTVDSRGNAHDGAGRFSEQCRPAADVTLTSRDALQAKRDALIAGRPTAQLILDLREVERQRATRNTEETRMVAAWLTDELLTRLPEVRERVHAWLDDDDNLDDERTTGQVIEDTVRDLAAEGK